MHLGSNAVVPPDQEALLNQLEEQVGPAPVDAVHIPPEVDAYLEEQDVAIANIPLPPEDMDIDPSGSGADPFFG